MFCTQCGKEIQDGAQFCVQCGKHVGGAAEPFGVREEGEEPSKSREMQKDVESG